MIVSLNNVKAVLQLTDNTFDGLILQLIPAVQNFVFSYCNNFFELPYNIIESSAIQFVSGSPAKIISDTDLFINLHPDMNIKVKNSNYNDGFYTISSATSNILTLSNEDTLIDENNSALVRISIMKVPEDVKLVIAKLIGEDLKNNTVQAGEPVVSESVGNHSVTYGGTNIKGTYPDELLKMLKPYKRVVFI